MAAQIDAGVTRFTKGSSLIQDGQRCAGTTVVSNTEITWAEPHPVRMSAQKAELVALKTSLELRKNMTQMAGVPLLSYPWSLYKERSLLMRKD